MRTALLFLLASALLVSLAHADQDELSGGVFIAHAPPGVVYTSNVTTWCDSTNLAECEDQVNTIAASTEAVWFVFSAWSEEKSFSGVEFGLGDFEPESFVFLEDGICLDNAMALPYGEWPGPNTGIAIAANADAWTGELVPIAWFAAYNYAEGDTIAITENPATGHAGWLSGESRTSYDADCLGALGLGVEGTSCCPGGEDGEDESDGSDGSADIGGPQWIDLGGEPFALDLVQSDGTTSVLELTVGGFSAQPIDLEGKIYYRIGLAEEPLMVDACLPELPYVPRSLIIPNDQRMTFRILSSEYVDLPKMPIAPSKGPLPVDVDADTVPYCFGSAYESGSLFPAELVRLDSPYILRDYRGLEVSLNPFQAMPASNSLRVYKHLLVEISPAGPDHLNVLGRLRAPEHVDRQFGLIYRNHFLNYGNMGALDYPTIEEDGSLLIIAYDDFYDAMLPLLEWKRQRGLKTEMVRLSDISDPPDTTAIHEYIRDLYKPEEPEHDLSFVLLVGDSAQVPCKRAPEDSISHDVILRQALSDPKYALMSGDDPYPDLLVGRFSAHDSSQVQTQVLRTIRYERDTGVEADWLGCAFGMAQVGIYAPYPHTNVGWMQAYLLELEAMGYDTTSCYGGYVGPGPVRDAVNGGTGILLASAHGERYGWDDDFVDFKAPQVRALTNVDMLPLVSANSCDVGCFAVDTCFAECWMWATQGGVPDGEPTGAIGAYMASRDLLQPGPQWSQDEMVRLLTTGAKYTVGGLLYNGECYEMQRRYAGKELNFLPWTLFGDPSLIFRTKAPLEMTVEHDGYVLEDAETYEVHVLDESGDPLRDACCAVYCPTTRTLYGADSTDEAGEVVIELGSLVDWPERLLLTVTGLDRVTCVGTISPGYAVAADGGGRYETIQAAIDAAPSGGFIVLADGEFTGDGNWDLDCGEKELTILSESGDPEICRMKCNPEGRTNHFGISFCGTGEGGLVLKNLTIVNGARDAGGAVHCHAETGPCRLRAYDCVFCDNGAGMWGGAVFCNGTATLSGCTFADNYALLGGGGVACGGEMDVSRCTFVENYSPGAGGGIYCWSDVGAGEIANTIIAFSPNGEAVYCGGTSAPNLSCCDLYGNADGDWVGCIEDQGGLRRNLSEDPRFCDLENEDFTIYQSSPCNQVTCGLIGAWPVGCSDPQGWEDLAEIPWSLELGSIGPNPVTGGIRLTCAIPRGSDLSRVRLTIHDVLGRRVKTLVDGTASTGLNWVTWDGRDESGALAPSGVYFCHMVAGGKKLTRQVTILR